MDTDIYVYDSFGILTCDSCSLETKVYAPDNKELIEYNYDQSDILVADNILKWKRNFNVVNGSDQKINFTSKICNDTRIFQDNYGVYSESGVVTKTMKKSSIGTWGKFENQISAGITDLVLCEEGVSITADPPGLLIVNFLDINKFKVDIAGEVANRELILATVRNYSESQILNMTNSSYNSLKNSIINWAADKGVPVTKLDGIRFYMGDGSGKCYIKLNDEETSGVAEKYKVLLNYFWGGANIKSKESLLGESITGENDIAGKIHLYHVQKVNMYGYSTYDKQSKGSKLIYNYDHKKYYD